MYSSRSLIIKADKNHEAVIAANNFGIDINPHFAKDGNVFATTKADPKVLERWMKSPKYLDKTGQLLLVDEGVDLCRMYTDDNMAWLRD